MATEGVPPTLHDRPVASGFTHFQQSGTGAIRKYYNYFRVTPMLSPLDDLGTQWPLTDEVASPGYYAATLGVGPSGVRCESTVGPKSALHRFTFPSHRDARVVIDVSKGGLEIEHGTTVPLRAELASVAPGVAQGQVEVEGVPLSVHIECDTPGWRQMLWYDRRLMAGGSRLEFDAIRSTTLRPFGLIFAGPSTSGQTVELRIGFSLRGVEQARKNLHADLGDEDGSAHRGRPTSSTFDIRRRATAAAWREDLDAVRVEGGSSDQQTIFATALYHSLIKPCLAADESPFWTSGGPFAFDVCTMWDIYKTQLPLLTTIMPERAIDLASALLKVCEVEGNLPIGYRMARGADRFSRQASALAHTFLADLCALGVDTLDWDWVLAHMHGDLRRAYGEEFLEKGVAHPISHTLDLTDGYACTAAVARHVGDHDLAAQLDARAALWPRAYDPSTGLLVDSTFYEGGRWNYSFRLQHAMHERIALAGGDEAFVSLLDDFFGFGAEPVKQLGHPPFAAELEAGYELHRFEGLNNEPDMEVPWAYTFAGRPDRTADVVHAAIHQQFGTGRGGLPGNDDSGGLSSWYVWASIGLFPVAGQSRFLLHPPAFPHARLRTGASALQIDTDGFAPPEPDGPPQFVQSVRVDGQVLDRSWMTACDLHQARQLVFELGPEPSEWGTPTAARP